MRMCIKPEYRYIYRLKKHYKRFGRKSKILGIFSVLRVSQRCEAHCIHSFDKKRLELSFLFCPRGWYSSLWDRRYTLSQTCLQCKSWKAERLILLRDLCLSKRNLLQWRIRHYDLSYHNIHFAYCVVIISSKRCFEIFAISCLAGSTTWRIREWVVKLIITFAGAKPRWSCLYFKLYIRSPFNKHWLSPSFIDWKIFLFWNNSKLCEMEGWGFTQFYRRTYILRYWNMWSHNQYLMCSKLLLWFVSHHVELFMIAPADINSLFLVAF